MKKITITRSISAFLLAATIGTALCGCKKDSVVPTETSLSSSETTVAVTTEKTAETSDTETTTPETSKTKALPDTDYVRLIGDVTPEMMTPDYWLKGADDNLQMSAEQINEFNAANKGKIKASDGKTVLPHPDDYEETLDGKILRMFLKDNTKSVPKDPSQYYLNGKQTTADYWQKLVALSNIDGVPDEINVRYAFTTKRMTVRLFPTEDRVFKGNSDKYFDELLFSECMPYMPVVALHESTDGKYLYVVFDSFAAWVRKDSVAICKDKEDWEARKHPDKNLVVTAREIRLGNDPYNPLTSNLVLPMGTSMELVPAEKAPKSINQRTTYGNYVVKVPTRGNDGFIKDAYVLIPVSDDVNAGYLPMTSANIVKQAFKLLGDRYGWGGDLQANDCTGITREIYRCFGLLLTRTGQSNSKGVYRVDMSKMNEKQKLEEISKLSPGSLISMPGHMMIYLGTVDGKPYVISACGSMVEPAPGPTELLHPNSVIINSLYARHKKLNTWLDTSTTVVTLKPAE